MTIDHKLILKEVGDYVGITLGLLLFTFGFTFFLMPYEIVTGGVSGIGAIVYYTTRVPISLNGKPFSCLGIRSCANFNMK